jgi:ADYC domain
MLRYSCFTALGGMALLGTGCLNDTSASFEAGQLDSVAQESFRSNDMHLNGIEFNGFRKNGFRKNGFRKNGVRINDVVLDDTSFQGTREGDGSTVSGNDFVGGALESELAGGGTVEIRVTAITPSGIPGLNYYAVEYLANGAWTNICWNDAQAIPLNGQWDEITGGHIPESDLFTFACRGAALAKCAEWGYQRWGTQTECNDGTCKQQSLAAFHQACTRMVRADYCGDGVPHTENGTSINIWDALGIQTQELGTGMPLEAEWTAQGAACVKHTRWANSPGDDPARDYILTHCPERWVGPDDTSCGGSTSDFHTVNGLDTPLSTRRLLRNESSQNYRYVE